MAKTWIIAKSGETEEIEAADLPKWQALGWEVADRGLQGHLADRDTYGSQWGRAAGMGLLRGLTLGASDWLHRKGSLDEQGAAEELRKLQEHNKILSIGGEVVGGGAGLLATGGLVTAARGGAGAVRAAQAARAAMGPATGLARVAAPAAKLGRWVGEGALGGAQQGISAAAMRPDGSFHDFGTHVLAGGAIGAGFGLGIAAAVKGGGRLFGKKWAGLEESHRLSKQIESLEAAQKAELAAVGSVEEQLAKAANHAEDFRTAQSMGVPTGPRAGAVTGPPRPWSGVGSPEAFADTGRVPSVAGFTGPPRPPSRPSFHGADDLTGGIQRAPELVGTANLRKGPPRRAVSSETEGSVPDYLLKARFAGHDPPFRGLETGEMLRRETPTPGALREASLPGSTFSGELGEMSQVIRRAPVDAGAAPYLGPVSHASPKQLAKVLREGFDPRMPKDVREWFQAAVDDGLEGVAYKRWLGKFRDERVKWLADKNLSLPIVATPKGAAARKLANDLRLLGGDKRLPRELIDKIEKVLSKRGALDVDAAKLLKERANAAIELPDHKIRLAVDEPPSAAGPTGPFLPPVEAEAARGLTGPPRAPGLTGPPSPRVTRVMAERQGWTPDDPGLTGPPRGAADPGLTGPPRPVEAPFDPSLTGPPRPSRPHEMFETAVVDPLDNAVMRGEIDMMRKLTSHKARLRKIEEELAEARDVYEASLDGARRGPASFAAQNIGAWRLGQAAGGGFGGYLAARAVLGAVHAALRPMKRGVHARLAKAVPQLREVGRNAAALGRATKAVTGGAAGGVRIFAPDEYEEAADAARSITPDFIAREVGRHDDPIAQEYVGRTLGYIRSIAPSPGPATTKNRVVFSLRYAAALDPETVMRSIAELSPSRYQIEAMTVCHPEAFGQFQDQLRYQILRSDGDQETYTDKQRRTLAICLGQPAHLPLETLQVFHQSAKTGEANMKKNQQIAAARTGQGAAPSASSPTEELARSM